jgi:hypothetical protein
MSLAVPFKRSELVTTAGTAARPNGDYPAAGPDWEVVLEGATHFGGALLPAHAQPPAARYLDWHRQKIFVA